MSNSIDESKLSDLLDHFMQAENMGDTRLAALVNKRVGDAQFLHRSNIRNWRNGSSQTVKEWRQLAAIAAALKLPRRDVDRLLLAGGCLPIHMLLATVDESDYPFLKNWQDEVDELRTTLEEPLLATRPLSAVAPSALGANELQASRSTELSRTELSRTELDGAESAGSNWVRSTGGWTLLGAAAVALVALLAFRLSQPTQPTGPAQSAESESVEIFSDRASGGWNFAEYTWDAEVEVIDPENDGNDLLRVRLAEYGGVTFFRAEPVATASYRWLEFRIRADTLENGDAAASDSTAAEPVWAELMVILDDDADFSNGEIGRVQIGLYVDEVDAERNGETWQTVRIPLADFSANAFSISQIALHSPIVEQQPSFLLNRVRLY